MQNDPGDDDFEPLAAEPSESEDEEMRNEPGDHLTPAELITPEPPQPGPEPGAHPAPVAASGTATEPPPSAPVHPIAAQPALFADTGKPETRNEARNNLSSAEPDPLCIIPALRETRLPVPSTPDVTVLAPFILVPTSNQVGHNGKSPDLERRETPDQAL